MSAAYLSYSVVICAYTLERWDLLQSAVQSVQAQTVSPEQILVCIDHNLELAHVARQRWESDDSVTVLENRFAGRLGSARNTAVERVTAEAVAFLDDDAEAPADWLERINAVFAAEMTVQAVGGGPRPRFESPRPPWFPVEFDWVFGCVYRGLPMEQGQYGRLIGACMAARTAAIWSVNGFHSDNHDDMDLSHRLIHAFGQRSVVFDPSIEVMHFVPSSRLRWSYFWRRCFNVNRGKVLAFANLAEAGNQSADVAFVTGFLTDSLPGYLRRPLSGGWSQAVTAVAGIGLAALGNMMGRIDLALGRAEPSLTPGLEQAASSKATEIAQ
jgi:cellulose synthase/poly-beta-1,6-N-acetylglucosamine synthase-like glycosyltransferase